MKIVHVSLASSFTDGLQYQENLLTKYHVKLGYDVSLITSKFYQTNNGLELAIDERADYFNPDDVHVYRLNSKDGRLDRFSKYPALYSLLDNIKPDIMFVHNVAFLDILTIRKYCRNNVSTVLYVDNHADYYNSAQNWLSKYILHGMLWRFMANKVAPYVRCFYGVLPLRVTFLRDIYKLPADQCKLLIMGADDEYVEKAKDFSKTVEKNKFYIVTGGKLNKYRPEVLELMKAVIELGNENIKLLFFGSVGEEYVEEFQRLSSYGNNIVNCGWLDAYETYQLLSIADLVVFPGLHSVMWEQSVALGKACVFRKLQGIEHLDLGGNAIFMDDVSKDNLKMQLNDLYCNPGKLNVMREVAETKGNKFLYSNIARASIEC